MFTLKIGPNGVWHLAQNCRVVQLTIIKTAATVLNCLEQVSQVMAAAPMQLGHIRLTEVKVKWGKSKKGEPSQMDQLLTQEAQANLVSMTKQEETRQMRSSLDGEEMRALWQHRHLIIEVLRAAKDPKAPRLAEQIEKMMDLWDEASEVLLALEWDRERSAELLQKMQAWRDHIHASFGPQLRMPKGEEFCDCIPVHYATEPGHLCRHAHLLYVKHGIAIGCLTDQAGEHYNQLVKHDVTAGQGSATNGHMSAKISLIDGMPVFKDNKFWLEMHRLHRIFFQHNNRFLAQTPRRYLQCGRCGAAGHGKNQWDKCPQHERYGKKSRQ